MMFKHCFTGLFNLSLEDCTNGFESKIGCTVARKVARQTLSKMINQFGFKIFTMDCAEVMRHCLLDNRHFEES